jgi:hypothetical protein
MMLIGRLILAVVAVSSLTLPAAAASSSLAITVVRA